MASYAYGEDPLSEQHQDLMKRLSGGDEAGNGGVGIERTIDGEVHHLSFGQVWETSTSDSFRIAELSSYQLLKESLKRFDREHGESFNFFKRLGKAFRPHRPTLSDPGRNYFLVDEVPEEVREEIVREFYEIVDSTDEIVFQEETDELVVYAFTIGVDTYLTPSFFLLDDVAQASILFHEMFRALNSTSSNFLKTIDIVKLEVAFEVWLRTGNAGFLQLMLGKYLNEPQLMTLGAVAIDLQNESLGLMSDGYLPFHIFGEDLDPRRYFESGRPARNREMLDQIGFLSGEEFETSFFLRYLHSSLAHEQKMLESRVDQDGRYTVDFFLDDKTLKDYRLPHAKRKCSTVKFGQEFFSRSKIDLTKPEYSKQLWKSWGVQYRIHWDKGDLEAYPDLRECVYYLYIEGGYFW